ncbi:acyltransferase family protein [Sutcliffiella horikoshii]|uniref:Acyltransferase family protein n=1 Tax=Sutcliffiella horikoshii TaxID=79883 RepID=A0A5D4T3X1_9BACI|nr:acyltransferase family protein [Sutcliffiella horikoshii]TYS69989.1 acyltransferase family protein [Sutcliffiella horikoshii]
MKKPINEIYWIRAIACLSVVAIHSFTRTKNKFDLPDTTIDFIVNLQLMMMFATPMFVLIFEVIVGNAYHNRIPKGFFKKRFLYLFLPFVFVPYLYVLFNVIYNDFAMSNVMRALERDLIYAGWHGYFILIILQFVVIHALFVKFFTKVPMWIMLIVSFVLNVTYLYMVAFHREMFPIIMQENYSYIRLPFVGWIFYFTVAYYVGKNLEKVRASRKWGLPLALIATGISLYYVYDMYYSRTITSLGSVRLDIMFYTVTLFFVLFFTFSYVFKVPKVVMFISKYAFSIYLLHLLSFNIAMKYLPKMNIILYSFTLFIIGIFGSVLMARLISLFPFGKYIIGPLKDVAKQKPNTKETQKMVA